MSITIEQLDATAAHAALPELIGVLDDAVQSGASVGFLLPLADGELESYWRNVLHGVANGARLLLVARQDGRIAGTVQVAFEARANSQHRAEIQKLLVPRWARQRGIGEALMRTAEAAARAAGRSLLVLDTRSGDTAERLYRRLGYQVTGVVPHYARSTEGHLEDCVFMYKELAEP